MSEREALMYVITGGAGFIGSNIAWGLNARRLGPVAVVDRLREAEKWRNLANRAITHVIVPEESEVVWLKNVGTQDS